MVDDAVGRVLAHLQSLGMTENTVVCFMSDHGDYLGDHGMFLKGLMNYQSIIRTPFIWKDPVTEYNQGQRYPLASTLDISTSILYRAGLQPANGMQGRDLFSEARDGDDSVLIELTTAYPYLGFDDLVAVSTVVKKNWRLSVWENCPWGELYDLENDPDELVNLWDIPACNDKKMNLMLDLIHTIQRNRETSPYPLSVS